MGAWTSLFFRVMGKAKRRKRTTSPAVVSVDVHADEDPRTEQIPSVLAGLEDLDMNEVEPRVRDERADNTQRGINPMMTASVSAAPMTVRVQVGRLHKTRTPKPAQSTLAALDTERDQSTSAPISACNRQLLLASSGFGQRAQPLATAPLGLRGFMLPRF